MSSLSVPDMISCKTYVESAHSILNWEIEKFSLICPNPILVNLQSQSKKEFFSRVSPINSPVITTILSESTLTKDGEKQKVDWYLSLRFTAAGNADPPPGAINENYISMYLIVKDPSNCSEVLGLIYNVSIVGTDEQVTLKKSTTMPSLNSQFPGWGWPQFISVKRLWETDYAYLMNDTLHIRVELDIAYKMHSKNLPCIVRPSHSLASELCHDLEQLLYSEKDADITVHCGDRTFPIHSTILKARSPVFERMLDADMEESIKKAVKIEDVDPMDFEAFLTYVYTSRIGFAVDNYSRLAGLVRVADKYDVVALKEFCFERLSELISPENAAEITTLAYLHSAGDKIRNSVVDFCTANWAALSATKRFQDCVVQNPAAFFKN